MKIKTFKCDNDLIRTFFFFSQHKMSFKTRVFQIEKRSLRDYCSFAELRTHICETQNYARFALPCFPVPLLLPLRSSPLSPPRLFFGFFVMTREWFKQVYVLNWLLCLIQVRFFRTTCSNVLGNLYQILETFYTNLIWIMINILKTGRAEVEAEYFFFFWYTNSISTDYVVTACIK